MASGVQGMIDLTVPGGGCSLSIVVVGAGGADGTTDDRRDCGSMKRMLKWTRPNGLCFNTEFASLVI
jgi:hypothetical protein